MTEPVAWRYKNVNQKVWCVSQIKPDERAWGIIEPLYTAEQLHRRVKMTQAEFDEFHDLFEKDFDLYSAITETSDTNLYNTLYDRLFTGTNTDKEKQNEFAILWANYNPLEPEETIEIVPEKKWFVRSKERNSEKNYYYFVGKRPDDYWQNYGYKMAAKQFETKEEAERWTNPDTEAVYLPVEEE